MSYNSSPHVRNPTAYLASLPSELPQLPKPAREHKELPRVPNHNQYHAQTQAKPKAHYPPRLPPKPAEYASTAQNLTATSPSFSPTPVAVTASASAPASTLPPTASFNLLDLANFEEQHKPIFSLLRFRVRVVQLMVVLTLLCVNFSVEIEYLEHNAPEVVNVARQLQITPETGRQHFFTFVTFLALLASAFHLLAIALVHCAHPQKPPKSRIVVGIAIDTIASLFLAIASTLLLDPSAVFNPSLSVSTDLRNVACVLSSTHNFGELRDLNAPYVNYPAICAKTWVSIVFGYLSLATFVVTSVVGIYRGRKLKVLLEVSYSTNWRRA